MELIDLVRGRWLALAIAAPVIAGVLVLSLLSTSAEERFEVSATVPVPQAVSSDLNQTALRTVLGDFANTFTSRGAAEDVASVVGGSPEKIASAASSVPAGEGSEVIVSLQGQDPVLVEAQLKLLTEIALTQLASDEVDNAVINRRAAERQLENAIVGLATIEAEAGTTDLLNEYRQRSAEVQQLRTEIARSFESPALQNALETVLDEKRAEAVELSVLVTQWELQRNQANEASAARDVAEREEFRAESKLDRVGADTASLRTQVRQVSSVTDAGVPVIAAMAVALAAVVVMAILWKRRDGESAEGEREEDDTGPIDDDQGFGYEDDQRPFDEDDHEAFDEDDDFAIDEDEDDLDVDEDEDDDVATDDRSTVAYGVRSSDADDRHWFDEDDHESNEDGRFASDHDDGFGSGQHRDFASVDEDDLDRWMKLISDDR